MRRPRPAESWSRSVMEVSHTGRTTARSMGPPFASSTSRYESRSLPRRRAFTSNTSCSPLCAVEAISILARRARRSGRSRSRARESRRPAIPSRVRRRAPPALASKACSGRSVRVSSESAAGLPSTCSFDSRCVAAQRDVAARALAHAQRVRAQHQRKLARDDAIEVARASALLVVRHPDVIGRPLCRSGARTSTARPRRFPRIRARVEASASRMVTTGCSVEPISMAPF